jgi:uncharacterized protein YndB with AHSA1/START domain
MSTTTAHESNAQVSGREMIISRTFDAPREMVFEAWTNANHLVHWWGPNGFTLTTKSAEIKAGGEWRFTMHGPDGRNYPNRIVFHEIVKPERLVYAHSGEEDDEVQFNTTVTFEAKGERTLLTMRAVFPSEEALQHVIKEFHALEGGKQHLGNLADYLQKM